MADKKYYIYSTLASAMNYQVVAHKGNDLYTAGQDIVIQGGANIPDKFMRTPDGAVVTPVSEQELEELRKNEVFKLHEANGFIVVKDKKLDPEKVAADMTGRDNSAPLVDADFAPEQVPVIAKPDDVEDDKRSQAPKPAGNGRRA